ncbi:MAG: hypothetical protein IPK87_00705 [Planctomycetes bacterium]|nr:hypothetical protein [Planctomycetota bacterium]
MANLPWQAFDPDEILDQMPKWTADREGVQPWASWVSTKVQTCMERAKKANEKQASPKRLPTQEEWLEAVLDALSKSEGIGAYSKFRLSLGHGSAHGLYPSIEHISTPLDTELKVEVRVVNDMKSILSVKEFKLLCEHLVQTLDGKPGTIGDDWEGPARDFSGRT